jgi:hypothetical protein
MEQQEREIFAAATRISSLEAKLELLLREEAKEIREMKEALQWKTRSFRDAFQSMPPDAQSCILPDVVNQAETAAATENNNNNLCEVCHDLQSIFTIVLCSHFSHCEECSGSCVSPLCKENKKSVLKIFMGS